MIIPTTNSKGHVLDKLFSSSPGESRLKLYLREADIDAGETLHSFRAGYALTLTFAGSQLAGIISHAGWSCLVLPATSGCHPGGCSSGPPCYFVY